MQNLVTKLAKIMGAVKNVPKRGYNAFHKYHYTLEADLIDAIRQLLAEEKIFIFSSVEEISDKEYVTDRQKRGCLWTVKVKYTLIDGDSGESMEVYGAGQGDDPADKGVPKALTNSLKFFLQKQFMVSSNDDPEQDLETDGRHYADKEEPPKTSKRGKSKKSESKQGKKSSKAKQVSNICQWDECDETVSASVQKYCMENEEKFGGKIFCNKHIKKTLEAGLRKDAAK